MKTVSASTDIAQLAHDAFVASPIMGLAAMTFVLGAIIYIFQEVL